MTTTNGGQGQEPGQELGQEELPQLSVVGGCCGTDARHVRAIAEALA